MGLRHAAASSQEGVWWARKLGSWGSDTQLHQAKKVKVVMCVMGVMGVMGVMDVMSVMG